MAKKQKIIWLVKYSLLIILLYILLQLLSPWLASEKFTEFISGSGVFWGGFIIMIYVIMSQILAPVPATPGIVLSAVVFGVPMTILYIYLAGLIGSSICFFISRKLGRKWIIKLSGKKIMDQVDEFSDKFGVYFLAISRVFGFVLFDVISYAAGLTKMKFSKFFAVTLFLSALPNIALAYFFRGVDLSSPLMLLIWFLIIVFCGGLFALAVKKVYKRIIKKIYI